MDRHMLSALAVVLFCESVLYTCCVLLTVCFFFESRQRYMWCQISRVHVVQVLVCVCVCVCLFLGLCVKEMDRQRASGWRVVYCK